MCEFCKQVDSDRIFGSEIPIFQCGNRSDLTEAQILKNCGDDIPGIVFYEGCKAMGYININYCPICGRNLEVNI